MRLRYPASPLLGCLPAVPKWIRSGLGSSPLTLSPPPNCFACGLPASAEGISTHAGDTSELWSHITLYPITQLKKLQHLPTPLSAKGRLWSWAYSVLPLLLPLRHHCPRTHLCAATLISHGLLHTVGPVLPGGSARPFLLLTSLPHFPQTFSHSHLFSDVGASLSPATSSSLGLLSSKLCSAFLFCLF